MKHKLWYPCTWLTFTLILPAPADVIYSSLLNTAIPLDFTGITVTLPGGGSVNPFFGGVGVANNHLLQPVRTGTEALSPINNLATGTIIDGTNIFSSAHDGAGYGGSQTHLGNTFTAGQEGHIGFKLNGSQYGWMRVVFTGNAAGAVIKDWAYEDSGSPIVIGRVHRSAVLSGVESVTLSPGSGETFTFGSQIADAAPNHTRRLVKSGSGKTTLKGSHTYTGATHIAGGTLALAADASIANTSEISLGTTGTFDVSAKTGGYEVKTLIGSGNVIGDLSVSTRLAIGNSPGTTHFSSDLIIGAEATYEYDVTSGPSPGLNSADLGDVAGNLTISTGAILDLVQLGTYTVGNKFTLFAYDGTLSGTFRNTSSTTLNDGDTFVDAGGNWQIFYADSTPGANGGESTTNRYVTITAIPEPNLAALLGSLGVLGLLRRRR